MWACKESVQITFLWSRPPSTQHASRRPIHSQTNPGPGQSGRVKGRRRANQAAMHPSSQPTSQPASQTASQQPAGLITLSRSHEWPAVSLVLTSNPADTTGIRPTWTATVALSYRCDLVACCVRGYPGHVIVAGIDFRCKAAPEPAARVGNVGSARLRTVEIILMKLRRRSVNFVRSSVSWSTGIPVC